MKLRLKEDPREWRKSTLLTVLGLALLCSLLRWRRILPPPAWVAILVALAIIALAAFARPHWFRGFYRLSMRAGFVLSQFVARLLLALIFLVFLTPFGWILRLAGKDPLQLKRRADLQTYWGPAKKPGSLDRLF